GRGFRRLLLAEGKQVPGQSVKRREAGANGERGRERPRDGPESLYRIYIRVAELRAIVPNPSYPSLGCSTGQWRASWRSSSLPNESRRVRASGSAPGASVVVTRTSTTA